MSEETDEDRRQRSVGAANAMRDLGDDEREELIAASPDVLDLRPTLADRQKQRIIATAYRAPPTP